MKVDLNKLDTAIAYVSRIADGNNPVNNRPVPNHEILNNPNVIRCMFFVKGILEEVKRNGGEIGRDASAERKTGRKSRFADYPFEIAEQFQYREDQSITYVMRQLQEPMEGMNIRKIAPVVITGWLKDQGYLTEGRKATGEKETLPTQKGEALGIYTRDREFNGRQYVSVIYDRQAQEFIASHLREAVDWKNGAEAAKTPEPEAERVRAGQQAGYEKLARKLLGNENPAEPGGASEPGGSMPDDPVFANMGDWMTGDDGIPF